ncbi:MAG: FtsX-like permease family protein [Pseudomonadales bacterium]|jgi:putative ABC transport system permease protein|nr:FtsX-like permease family protein [Pseudomonadales bacterium]
MSLLLRAQLRDLARERFQVLLAVLGIAVGVAVVVAVDLVNASSRVAMDVAGAQLSGRATHLLVGPGDRVDEQAYAALRLAWREGEGPLAGATALTPVVEGRARPAARDDLSLRLLGVDPIADRAVRTLAPGLEGDARLAVRLLTEPDAVLLDRASARRLGIAEGDMLELMAAGRLQRLRVVGLLAASDRVLGSGLVVADIATVQEVLGMRGDLSRIDVVLPARDADGVSPWISLIERIFPGLVVRDPGPSGASLGAGLELIARAERDTDLRALSSSFQLNLAALGLLALVVGLFLVHGTLSYSVWRRQRAFGRLRAIGVLPAELQRLILVEAACMAVAGTLLGLVGGRVLAGGLLELISATLQGLYEQVAIGALAPDPVPYLKGAAVGLLGSLAVALPAARRAARTSPRALLLATPRRLPVGRRARAAAVLGGLAMLALTPGTGYLGALLAIALLLLSAALVAGPLLGALLAGLAGLARHAPAGTRMLLRETVRGLGRSGIATAALVVAIATAVGMEIMVDSFRGSVERWLEGRLAAPLYARLPDSAAGTEALERVLEALDVQGWVARHGFDQRVSGRPVRIVLTRVRGSVPQDLGLALLAGAWREDGVLVAEPLARALGVDSGARLAIETGGGPLQLPVQGIFREYGGGRGTIVMPARLWPSPPAGLDSFEIHDARDPDVLIAALQAAVPVVELRRNDEILAFSLSIFDRTFRVTGVLQSIAGAVAAFGLFGALSALALDRRTQYGVLRTLGVGRAMPALQALGEALLLAGAAALLAMPLGMIVAVVLVEFVNVRAFGWSLDLAFPPGVFLRALLVALAAGAAAVCLPAVRLWRARPADLLADARAAA